MSILILCPDGNYPARTLYLHLLWQGKCFEVSICSASIRHRLTVFVNTPPIGLRQTNGSWHLEMRCMQKGYRGRRLDCINNRGCDRTKVCAVYSCSFAVCTWFYLVLFFLALVITWHMLMSCALAPSVVSGKLLKHRSPLYVVPCRVPFPASYPRH
jgi:hypothetical protein